MKLVCQVIVAMMFPDPDGKPKTWSSRHGTAEVQARDKLPMRSRNGDILPNSRIHARAPGLLRQ